MKPLSLPAVAAAMMLIARVAGATDGRLINAVRQQDIKAVQALLQQGVDVNEPQADGATALQWAAYHDNVPVAEALLRAGANVKAANQLGITAVILASANGNPAMVDLLLKAGADPNAGPTGGATPVMTAARVGSADVVKLLLAHGGNANAKETLQGQTALMWAAAERHPDVVRVLVEGGADVHARTNIPPEPRRGMGRPAGGGGGAGAGNAAAAGGIAAAGGANAAAGGNGGANAVTISAANSNGFTPLLFAARVGDIESARVLLQAGADVNEATADGMSALVLATVRGYPQFAMFLLDKGANANAAGAGYTALHWAAGTWESELTVRAINGERGEWRTIAGLREGKLELVKALLAHGADPNARMKKAPARAGGSKNPALPELEGAPPLVLAAMAGSADVMRALVAGGADIKLGTKAHGTILMAAAGLGHVQGENTVPESDVLVAVQAALELGADPKAADDAGNTALHYAGYMRHDSVIQLLVEKGVPLDATNKYGETGLWTSELVVQFSGGGVFTLLPSSTGDLLRKLGAKPIKATYTYARPTEWPDNPRSAADQVAKPETPKDARQ